MSTLILRAIGAVLAILGLVTAVIGGWFLAGLGTSGTATFTAEPGQRVVVLEPDVLNRVDHAIEVTATGTGSMWVGTTRPSDAEAVLGDGARAEISSIDVTDWALTTTSVGDGDSIEPDSFDIWQSSNGADEQVSATIDQSQAPQTLVISAPQGEEIDRVEMVVSNDGWGTTALVVLVGGLILFAVGLFLLVRTGTHTVLRRRLSRTTSKEGSA